MPPRHIRFTLMPHYCRYADMLFGITLLSYATLTPPFYYAFQDATATLMRAACAQGMACKKRERAGSLYEA